MERLVGAERESAEVVHLDDRGDILVVLHESHDGRGREDDLQIREAVVATAQFARPVGVLEHLVEQQHTATAPVKLAGKLHEGVLGEIEIVEIDVEATALRLRTATLATLCILGQLFLTQLLGMPKQEIGFPHSATSLDSNEAIAPVDVIHHLTMHRHLRPLDEVVVNLKKGF